MSVNVGFRIVTIMVLNLRANYPFILLRSHSKCFCAC